MKRFPEKIVADRIRFDNSWWKTGRSDEYYHKMKRRSFFSLFFCLLENKNDKRSILMLGTKRVGKTTLIFQAIQEFIEQGVNPKNLVYLSLENPIYYRYNLQDIMHILFFGRKNTKNEFFYIFFDKIQYHIGWEEELISLTQNFPEVKFIFSVSVYNFQEINIKDIQKHIIHFRLPTLTFYEYVNFIHSEEFFDCDEDTENCNLSLLDDYFKDYLKFGGYPELILSKKPYREVLRLFPKKILNCFTVKAFPNLLGLDANRQINAFIAYLIFNTGREISYDIIVEETDLLLAEIVEYLAFLKTIFFIRILKPFESTNESKYFKVYITNTSYIYAVFDYENITNYINANNLIETAILSQWEHLESEFLYHTDNENNISFLKPTKEGGIEWCTAVNYSSSQIMNMDSFVQFCMKNDIYFPVFATQAAFDTIEKGGLLISQQPVSLYCYQVGRYVIETELSNFNKV